MLLYLTNKLILEKEHPLYHFVIAAVENVLKAGFEGKHFVMGDYEVLEILRKNDELSFEAKALANRLYNNYPTTPMPEEITFCIELVIANPCPKRTVNNRNIIQMPISYFSDSSRSQSSILLGEFENDCSFFEYLLVWYKYLHGIRIPTDFDKQSGGGSSTSQMIEKYVGERNRITICIVDTDKKYPEHRPTNTTYDKCKNLYNDVPYYLFFSLEVHEIENLIPYNIIDELKWPDKTEENRQHFAALRSKTDIANDVLPYFDLKEGIKKSDIINNPEYYSFANKIYNTNKKLVDTSDFSTYVASLQDGEFVCKGLWHGILKDSLGLIKEKNISPKDFEPFGYQQPFWCKIGQCMLNWGCASSKENIY